MESPIHEKISRVLFALRPRKQTDQEQSIGLLYEGSSINHVYMIVQMSKLVFPWSTKAGEGANKSENCPYSLRMTTEVHE